MCVAGDPPPGSYMALFLQLLSCVCGYAVSRDVRRDLQQMVFTHLFQVRTSGSEGAAAGRAEAPRPQASSATPVSRDTAVGGAPASVPVVATPRTGRVDEAVDIAPGASSGTADTGAEVPGASAAAEAVKAPVKPDSQQRFVGSSCVSLAGLLVAQARPVWAFFTIFCLCVGLSATSLGHVLAVWTRQRRQLVYQTAPEPRLGCCWLSTLWSLHSWSPT